MCKLLSHNDYKFYEKKASNKKNIFHKCAIHFTEIVWKKWTNLAHAIMMTLSPKIAYKGNIALDK